ncbi:MAG: leucine-rich repeat domain-containing protein [Salinivirgaceae bacterium]|nr:leucine-rich repeat domain-containing protein [Salinivirgaceae bacterium]
MRNKILIAAFLLMARVSAWAEGSFIYGNLKYTVIDSVNRYVSVSKGETELKGELNIPATATNNNSLYMVTTIGSFYNCEDLTSVTISEVVTDIYSSSFYNCNKLTEINVAADNPKYSSKDGVLFNKDKTTLVICPGGKTGTYLIPDFVVKIVSGAFGRCNGLVSVTIPNSVRIIESGEFEDCKNLTEINVDSANEKFSSENGVLFNKDKTQLIRFPEGKNGSYSIPNSVNEICSQSFSDCSGLKSLTIPNSVTSISDYAFPGSIHIETLEYNTNAVYDDYGLFIPTNSLKTVVIGDDVTYIGNSAFRNCSSLASVTIGNSVKKIGDLAFNGYSNLVSVTIPNSVTDIGEDAFGGVKNINYSGSATGSPWSAFCLNGTIDGNFIYVDAEKTKLAGYFGNETNVTIPDNVTSIGNWAILGYINSIIIPNSVKEIEPWAFSCPGATVYLLCTEEEWTTSFDWYWNHKNSGEIVWGYTPTPVTETAANAVNIYAYGRSIVVENAAEEISVYDAMGRLVCRDAINRVRTEICVNNPGLYIVKVGNVAKRVVVK